MDTNGVSGVASIVNIAKVTVVAMPAGDGMIAELLNVLTKAKISIDIVVTSVLQTTAGKMIFGRYIEGPPTVQSQPQPAAPVAASTSPVAAGPAAAAPAVSRAQNAK